MGLHFSRGRRLGMGTASRCALKLIERNAAFAVGCLSLLPRLNSRHFGQFPLYTCHALHLAFRREALVESFVAKRTQLLAPGRKPLLPALHPVVVGFGILR